MNTRMPTSSSRKTKAPTPSERHYSQAPYGTAVANLTGLQPGIPMHTSLVSPSLHWSQRELHFLLELIQNEDAPAIEMHNPYLLARRVGWRMRVNGIYSFRAYKDMLVNNPAELPALRKSLKMKITSFFEDIQFFVALEKIIFPTLIQRTPAKGIHILLTQNGGTIEDAFSIAMLFEFLKLRQKLSFPLKVSANTDKKSLQPSFNEAYYPHLITADLSPNCLTLFFEPAKEGYKISSKLTNTVHCAPAQIHDLAQYSDLDLVVSFSSSPGEHEDPADQVQAKYDQIIRPGGFLVTNRLPDSSTYAQHFKVIDNQQGIYQRRLSPKLKPPIKNAPLESIPLKTAPGSTDRLQRRLTDNNQQPASNGEPLKEKKDQLQEEYTALQAMVNDIMKANHELKLQNKQLQHNSHLIESMVTLSGAGILLLDDQLCVKKFTPVVAQIFNLKSHDIGRPFSHIESPFQYSISQRASSVLRSRTPAEHEYPTQKACWYRIQLSPLIQKDVVTGIVCSFINITESKRANEWDRFKASVLNKLEDTIIITNNSNLVTYINKAGVNRFGLHHKKRTGFPIDDLYQDPWLTNEKKEILLEILEDRGLWSGEVFYRAQNGKNKRAQTTIRIFADESGEKIGQLHVIHDRSTIKQNDTSTLHRMINDLIDRNEAMEKA